MPTSAPFSCCLTGTAGFTIQCGELLLSKGHPLVVVVSESPEVCGWATQRGIRVLPNFDSLIAGGSTAEFDYLFSAINGVILPSEVLRLPRRAAVNYHNGPLPRYAGVHAASWALLNGETVHGVTWHQMIDRVDAGPIYLQRMFALDGMATAGQVNETCRALGLQGLGDLITRLEIEQTCPVAQNLTRRSYFRGDLKHPSAGLISWHCDAARIARVVGAHQLGSVMNTFGSAKLELGGRCAVVSAAVPTDIRSMSRPGTVVTAGDGCLRVATRTNDIDLMGITDLAGHAIATSAQSGIGLPRPGHVLPSLAPGFAEKLAKRLEVLSPDESFCAQLLKAADRTPLPMVASDAAQPRTTTTLGYSCAGVDADLLELTTLSATALTVREATGRDRVSVEHRGMLCAHDLSLSGYLRRGLPITVSFGARYTVTDVLEQVADQLARSRGRDVFSRDVALRRRVPVGDIPIRAGVGLRFEQDLAGAQLGVFLQPESAQLHVVSDRRQAWPAASHQALQAYGARVREWLELCRELAQS
jgi:methionyl-tRNA formyltransferase